MTFRPQSPMQAHADHTPDPNRTGLSATVHCLTGCALGEVVGMAVATALAWGNAASIALSVALAFVFGYALALRPVLRAGLGFRRASGVVVAAETVSISIMEAIDNLFVVLIPGALAAGLGDAKFWWSIAAGFAIAFGPTFLANRWLIVRGRGHAVMHELH